MGRFVKGERRDTHAALNMMKMVRLEYKGEGCFFSEGEVDGIVSNELIR